MSIPEHRLSTTVVESDWLSPDERARPDLDEDYEQGPVALNDTSEGLSYQAWHLTWDDGTGDFTATPETTGPPVVVLNVAGVTQCSLAFDQNGHISIAYMVAAQSYLYWYDTVAADWVTDALDAGVTSPHLTLDDKRTTQTQANDIILWYTTLQGDATYDLFTREQRDRYTIEYPMEENVKPWIVKCGMNDGLRLQIGLRATP